MGISTLQYIVSMAFYVAILLLMVEVMRKNHRFALVFWILSLLTFPLWFNQIEGWFRWAKTLSVLIPTALFVGFGRLANFEDLKGKWELLKTDGLLWLLYGVLFLNILEATIKDFTTANYANAIVGVILCITIPLVKFKGQKQVTWQFSKQKPGDLLVFTSPMWNFVYTTWNLAFVFGENAGYFASSLCILVAAELYPILKKRPELYVTARVYTLAFHILIRACYDVFSPIMDSTSWANDTFLSYWGIVNLLLAVAFFAYWLKQFVYRQRVAN